MSNFFQQNSKKIFLSLIVLILIFSFLTDILLFQTEAFQVMEDVNGAAKQMSPFADPTPRINKEAASIVCENEETCESGVAIQSSAVLPVEVWIFLLGVYVFLLLFNLFPALGKNKKICWLWEALFTLLAFAVWFVYDIERSFIWYPLYVLKFGLIIYLFYLYLLLGKDGKKEPESSGE